MMVIALLLSPRYQLFSEATPRTIVGTEGTVKVLLSRISSLSVIDYTEKPYNEMILSSSNIHAKKNELKKKKNVFLLIFSSNTHT
jgi:hypothetical protein